MPAPGSAPFTLGPRRGYHCLVGKEAATGTPGAPFIEDLERLDLIYRTLCAILFNFVPTSGHPGGSISSGRIVAALLFRGMDYDLAAPEREDADVLSYAAGHKAMGLYAMWALRNEIALASMPELVPATAEQLRLEDLLGFRRNPTTATNLFRSLQARPLDGHPTPLTPFVRLATGASGVGLPASLGLAMAARDTFGQEAPRVHILEGEGGMTAGRVSEALAIAGTARLDNAVLHVDWNQASIDSERVCRDGATPGDYVQWDPAELAYLNDWNVIRVADGHDLAEVLAAQRLAAERRNGQPTAIVYRTVKGWRYGLEGRASHGAGHAFCSPAYYRSLEEFERTFGVSFPRAEAATDPDRVERAFWEALGVVRGTVRESRAWARRMAEALSDSRRRLEARARAPARGGPSLEAAYSSEVRPGSIPPELVLAPGSSTTLRAALADVVGHLNRLTRGAFIGGAADLLGSTSLAAVAKGFPAGYFDAQANPGSRIVACGGICEDAMGAFMAGISSFGRHVGISASYAAFIAALQHVPARLHGIGQQGRRDRTGEPYRPLVIVCGHAGLKTGEDGATHADPQPLQLLQDNFPRGVAISLTPWEPQELWPLFLSALQARPAVISVFVTRPTEKVPDRGALGLPPATRAADGVYALRSADPGERPYHGTVVLQESGVTYTFVEQVLPELDRRGFRLNVYSVASSELFDLLTQERQDQIFPSVRRQEAMGITGYTLPTLHRWVCSDEGRRRSLHPFRSGRYLGSGQAAHVLREAGLDARAQLEAVVEYGTHFARRAG